MLPDLTRPNPSLYTPSSYHDTAAYQTSYYFITVSVHYRVGLLPLPQSLAHPLAVLIASLFQRNKKGRVVAATLNSLPMHT